MWKNKWSTVFFVALVIGGGGVALGFFVAGRIGEGG
ncbi:MAG: hypothetical protein QG606_386 [Patescibacteria group bacterium]|nr:hypothetical protein [Patescibacteria group bacterium]